MLALDAEIHLKGAKGCARRSRPSTSSRGCSRSIWPPDEIIAGVQFAPVKAAAYAKLHQRASHFAIVGVAAALEVKGGVIQSARIGLTGASIARDAADRRRAGAGGKAGVGGEHRGRGADRRRGAGRRQRRHPRQRGVPPRDDSGVRASARLNGGAGAASAEA